MIRIHCSYIKNKLVPVTTARQFYAYLIYGSTLRKTASQRTSIRMIGTCINMGKRDTLQVFKKKMNRRNENRKKEKERNIDGWRDKDRRRDRQRTDRQGKTTLCFTPSNNEIFKINRT